MMTTYSAIAENGAEIRIENRIVVGSELVFKSPQYGEDYKWELVKKPFFSEAVIIEENGNAYFRPDVAGEYTVKLIVDGQSYGEKQFQAIKNTRMKETSIIEEMEEYYRQTNLYLFVHTLNMLEANYSKSKYIKTAYQKAVELAKLYNNNEIYIEYLLKIDEKYVMGVKERKIYLEKLYEFYTKENKLEKSDKILDELVKIDIKYLEKKAKRVFKADELKGLKLLESYYEKSFDKDTAKFLADYYFENKKYSKAEMYYLGAGKSDAVRFYIRTGNKEKLEYMLENIGKKERIEVQKVVLEEKVREKENDYYMTAKKNEEKYKFKMARIYYNKILKESSNEDLKIKVLYQMGKVSFMEKKYEEARKYFEEFLTNNINGKKRLDSLYHLGVISFNTKNYALSEKYFHNLISEYPGTIWSTKASIYKLKIKNKKES